MGKFYGGIPDVGNQIGMINIKQLKLLVCDLGSLISALKGL